MTAGLMIFGALLSLFIAFFVGYFYGCSDTRKYGVRNEWEDT